ncbi:hypothetical protein ACWKSP_28330 [Micromonosporaceae bacterium Da 78-11]
MAGRLSRRQLMIAVGAGVVALAVFAGVAFLVFGPGGADPGDKSWHTAASQTSPPPTRAPLDPSADVTTADPTAPAKLFLGSKLTADNPDRLKLASGATVILRDKTSLLHMTPGQVEQGAGQCTTVPYVTVTVTVQALAGSATIGPEAFRLRTKAGTDVAPLAECTSGFATTPLTSGQARKGKLAFAATDFSRLRYGSVPKKPTAVWRLK